jgi:hypothetical protein
MTLAYAVPVTAGCAVLAWAGLEKLRNPEPLTATVAELGLPVRAAALVALAVPAIELGTVVLVVAGTRGYLPAALFAALGAGFAGSAAWSMLSGRRVACSCFGAGDRDLGWPQLAALPAWLLAAWSAVELPVFSTRERLGALACGTVVIAAARAVPALRLGLTIRRERHARAGG